MFVVMFFVSRVMDGAVVFWSSIVRYPWRKLAAWRYRTRTKIVFVCEDKARGLVGLVRREDLEVSVKKIRGEYGSMTKPYRGGDLESWKICFSLLQPEKVFVFGDKVPFEYEADGTLEDLQKILVGCYVERHYFYVAARTKFPEGNHTPWGINLAPKEIYEFIHGKLAPPHFFMIAPLNGLETSHGGHGYGHVTRIS